MSKLKELKYQPHVDGLRALAVIAVFVFHLVPNILPGGYLGVDVFFVISGFVISQSLYKKFLETGRIDISKFYVKRFMRLYPALLVMVSTTTIFYMLLGFLWDTNLFIKSGITSIFAVSNLYFIKHGNDYFHQDLINPFLHTWSLGVEEQFYFVYPILLSLVLVFFLRTKFKELAVGLFFLSTTIILYTSFVVNTGNIWGDFYWPFARFWEISAGCALFFFSQKYSPTHFKSLMPVIGLGIILSVFVFQDMVVDLHKETLLVVMGTSLIIFSGINNYSSLIRFLQYKPVLFIGTLSYSLYLWHLPVIYFFNLYFDTFAYIILSLIVTVILALLSFCYVEKKYRYSTSLEAGIYKLFKPLVLLFVFSVFVIFFVGFSKMSLFWNISLNKFSDHVKDFNYLEVKANLSDRVEKPYLLAGREVSRYCGDKQDDSSIIDFCLKNNSKDTLLYLTGNSHALHFVPMVDYSEIDSDIYFNRYPLNEIIFNENVLIKDTDYSRIRVKQLKELSERYEKVIIMTSFFLTPKDKDMVLIKNRFSEYINLYGEEATLIFVAPTPVFATGPASCVAVGVHCGLDVRLDQIRREKVLNMFLDFERQYENVYIYDPYEYLCSGESCYIYDKDRDFLLYRDDDHLSVEASISLAPHFRGWFNSTFADVK